DLVDGVGQWLFEVDVLARLEGPQGREGVHVVRRADDDGLDVFLVEEAAKVLVEAGPRVGLPGRAGAVDVHVAQGDDVLAADAGQVLGAAAGGADDAEVEAVVGGGTLFQAGQRTGQGERGGCGGGAQKT